MTALPDLAPPQSLEAEQAALGAMLVDPGAVVRGLKAMHPDDCYREAHRTIAAAIVAVREAGNPVDLVTVGDELRRQGQLESVGGAEYLTALIDQVPTTAHIVRYATIVHEKALLRRLISELAQVQRRAYQEPEDVALFVAEELAHLRELATEAAGGQGAQPIANLLPALVERLEVQIASVPGVSAARTGITQVDRLMGGLAGWGLVVPRADTKVGKSLFAGQSALASAREFRNEGGKRWVLVYALEGPEEFEERAVAWLGGFNKMLLETRGQAMTADERGRYELAVQELASLPLAFTGTVADVSAICADVEAQALQGRVPGLVVVDHFQRTSGGMGDSLTLQLTDRARQFAQLAVRMRCPVMVPSQVTVGEGGVRQTMWARGIAQEASLVIDMERGNGKGNTADYNWGSLWFANPRRQIPWSGKLRWYVDEEVGDAHLYDEPTWEALGRRTADE